MRPDARLALCALLPLCGCLSPVEPVPLRWFAPPAVAITGSTDAQAGLPLRIGRVEAAPHLGTAFVWRLSDVEVALDEVNRWADEPAAFVARALDRSLHGSGTFTDADHAPRLDVRIDAFEAVLGDQPKVRLAAELLLTNPADATFRRESITVEQPLKDTGADQVARALGEALTTFAARTTTWCAAK